MTARRLTSSRGFTLVELLVSMSIGSVVMLAVFSTYTYLGRNLTRLSYRSILENQSRKILTILATDIRNARSVANSPATSPSATTLSLKMADGTTVVYAYNTGTNKLTRDPDGSGPLLAVELNTDIKSGGVTVPVEMSPPSLAAPNNIIFRYYTTSGGDPVSQFASPAPPITPMSIKQVALSFTLQASSASTGAPTIYQAASGRMLLMNHQLPDGS